jgi:hypothetical protein
MVDNFAIYSSCVLVVYIIWRAALLDRTLPWFRPFQSRRPLDADIAAPRAQDAVVPPWRRR